MEVRAPLRASKSDIDRFVVSKEKWIADKMEISAERVKQQKAFTLNYGDTLLYRGKEYPITARAGDRGGFDDEQFYVPANLTSEQINNHGGQAG